MRFMNAMCCWRSRSRWSCSVNDPDPWAWIAIYGAAAIVFWVLPDAPSQLADSGRVWPSPRWRGRPR